MKQTPIYDDLVLPMMAQRPTRAAATELQNYLTQGVHRTISTRNPRYPDTLAPINQSFKQPFELRQSLEVLKKKVVAAPNKRLYISTDEAIKEFQQKQAIKRHWESKARNQLESTISQDESLNQSVQISQQSVQYSQKPIVRKKVKKPPLIDESTASVLFEEEMKEMRKMKKQFVKELKALIDSEILKEKQRKAKEERVLKHQQKVEQLEQEKKILQQDKVLLQHAHNMSDHQSEKVMSRNSSMVKFSTVGAAPVVLTDVNHSLEGTGLVSEGAKRKAEMLIRLKQKSEVHQAKVEQLKTAQKQQLDDTAKQLPLDTGINNLRLSLDLKRLEQIKLRDERAKREELRKAKLDTVSQIEELRKSQLLKKLDDNRIEQVTARRWEQVHLKQEVEKVRVEQQKTKLQILKNMKEQEQEEKLTQRERQRERASSLRKVKRELQQARKQMAKEFIEKKALIIHKLRELKSNQKKLFCHFEKLIQNFYIFQNQNNKSIEEIYKYTNEIIVEEEDEEEEEAKVIAPESPKILPKQLSSRKDSAAINHSVIIQPDFSESPRSVELHKRTDLSMVDNRSDYFRGSVQETSTLPNLTNTSIAIIPSSHRSRKFAPNTSSSNPYQSRNAVSLLSRQSLPSHSSHKPLMQHDTHNSSKPLYDTQQSNLVVELIKRRQKQEILALLHEEEEREQVRMEFMQDNTLSREDRAGLQGRFNVERRQAQAKIERLMQVHEGQLMQYQ